MRFWKRKPIGRAIAAAVTKPRYYNVHITYEDGTITQYKRILGVYPLGEHGSHLRIDFADPVRFLGSFIIISLSHVQKIEGTVYTEEEPKPNRQE